MNTPDDPRTPDEGVDATTPLGEPPVEASASPPFDGSYSNNHMLGGDLPPLEGEGDGDDGSGRRRFLSGGRLVAAGVAVLVLLGGGVALATSGGDPDKDDNGVATVDGGDGEQASDDGSGDDEGPSPDEMQDAMLEYAACMREHGIDMPDPEFTEEGGGFTVSQEAGEAGGGPGDEDFAAADEECGEIMEDIRSQMPDMDPAEVAELQDKLLVMAQCMRDKGYDFPDPEVSSDGGVMTRMGGPNGEDEGPQTDPNSAAGEQMQEDMSACNEEAGLDTPGDGPGGGPAIAVGGDT
jgi:hypothetical protein